MNYTDNTITTDMDRFTQRIEELKRKYYARTINPGSVIVEELDELLNIYNSMKTKLKDTANSLTQDRDTNYIPISEHNRLMDEQRMLLPSPDKYVSIDAYSKVVEDRDKVIERRDRWKQRFWTASGDLHVAQKELENLKERNKVITHEVLSKDNEVMLLGEEITQLNQKNVFLQNELDKVKKEKEQLKQENDLINSNGSEDLIEKGIYPCIASFTDILTWISEADGLLGGLNMQVNKEIQTNKVRRYNVTAEHLRNSLRHWHKELCSYTRANTDNQKIIEDLKKQLKEMSEANKKSLTLEQELEFEAKKNVGMDYDGDAVSYPEHLTIIEAISALTMIKKIGLKRVYLKNIKKPFQYICVPIEKIQDYIGNLINSNGEKTITIEKQDEELEDISAKLAKANSTIAYFSTENDKLRLDNIRLIDERDKTENANQELNTKLGRLVATHYESCNNYERTIDTLTGHLNTATKIYNERIRVPKAQQLMDLYALLEKDDDGYVGFKRYISETFKRTKDTKTEAQILADIKQELNFVFGIVTKDAKTIEENKKKEQ